MSDWYDAITDELRAFIEEQKMFFVASAAPQGRINLSPKGLDTLRIVDRNTVAYLDLTGSGIETAAHARHDGRLTMMFCSFSAKPMILRLYGRARVLRPADSDWDAWMIRFTPMPGQRQIIVMSVESVQTSCGYGVPRYDFRAERDTLCDLWEKLGPEATAYYAAENNQKSIDGLPLNP